MATHPSPIHSRMVPPAQQARTSQVRRVVRVAAGNALEMYDFQIFAYYAAAIAVTFFPSGNEYASLMFAFATFGAGFLMRPLGAVILGAYIDHHGRRKGLLVTLALMAVGTLSIALLPGYVAIGLAAPLLVLVGRLLQGFSAGVELGGVSVYLSEIATTGRKGFYVAWQSASQQVAVMFAAVIGLVLTLTLSTGQIQQWGWRIPFLAGCTLLPFLFMLRRSLEETEAFLARAHAPRPAEIARSVAANWRLVLLGMMMATMTTVSFYFVTAYTPTFGANVLHLAASGNLVVTLCVGACNLLVLPLSGALSDKIGRRPILIACTIAALATAYPTLQLAGERTVFFQAPDGGTVAGVYLRGLQRRDGRVLDRDHAGGSAHFRILGGLQPGDRCVRRVHAGHLHLSDSRDREPRDAGRVAIARRRVRAYRGTRAVDSTGAQVELAFIGPHPHFRPASIHLGSMCTIAEIRCPDISCEIVIRVAASASQVGRQIETAVARHPRDRCCLCKCRS